MSADLPSLPPSPPPLPPQALQRVHVVFYADEWGKVPTVSDQPWPKFVELLTKFAEQSPCTAAPGPKKCIGKECPHKSFSQHPNNPMAWAPTVIEGNRLDVNVRALTLLTLDFDHASVEQCAFVHAKLKPYEHVWHTTHNHRGGDDNGFRAALLLSRQVHANQWHRFLAAAIDFLGVTFHTTDTQGKQHRQPDPTCKNRSRFYYRPSHPSDIAFEAGHVVGRVLDVDKVLRWAEEHLAAIPIFDDTDKRPLPEPEDWDLDSPFVEEAIDCISRYLPHKHRNDLALAIGGMLRSKGASEEVARYIIFEGYQRGGSDNPHKRAKTVEHTYSLSDESAMTGFTSACEFMGDDEARELGRYLSRAASAVYRRDVLEPMSPPPSSTNGAHVNGTSGSPLVTEVTKSSPPVPFVTTFEDLEARVKQVIAKKKGSDKRNDKIKAVLLRRMLAREPLVPINGLEDVETRCEDKEHGVSAEQAVNDVAFELGFHLPLDGPWSDTAALLMRVSLANTPGKAKSGESWLRLAEGAFGDGKNRRRELDDENKRATETQRQIVRQAALQASAGGGGSPPPVPPAPPLPPTPPPDGPQWRDLLTKGPNGSLAQTLHNIRVLLRNHEDFCGHLRWNEVAKCVEVTGGPMVQYSKYGIEDIVNGIQDHLASAHGIVVQNSRPIGARVVSIARRYAYDPLKTYLNRALWDGVDRMTDWLVTYCGAIADEDNREFLHKVGRRWLIALVARGLDPGCKVDNVLVLEGKGGMGKSMVFEILGGEWFCDTAISLGDKDSRMMAGRYWLCELAEIVAFKKNDHNQLKSFFSSRIDRFRPPYGSAIEESPRRCIWVGTTNDESYLGDETGNRKYWTVACQYTAAALGMLRQDRDQLLAQAVAAYRAGERWHFTYEEIDVTEKESEKRMLETPAKLKVQAWWYGMNENDRRGRFSVVTTLDVFEEAFDSSVVHVRDGDLQRIGHALKKLGFVRKRDSHGPRQWRYFASEELLKAPRQSRGGLAVYDGGKDKPIGPGSLETRFLT